MRFVDFTWHTPALSALHLSFHVTRAFPAYTPGTPGRITLETPEEFAQWLAAGQKLDAGRQLKKDSIQTEQLVKLKKIPRPASSPWRPKKKR